MKKEKIQTIQKMWKNPRQKALLKLGMWFCFFVVIAIMITITNLFSKSTPQNQTQKKEEVIPPKENISFPDLENLWSDLEQKDYNYSYQIYELDSKELITYQGTKKKNLDEGYRESKLGIIKYRIIGEKTYQIIMEQEEEIENLYQEEDETYLNLSWLKEKIKNVKPEENINGSLRYLTFPLEEKIIITTNQNAIVSMKITTKEKDYQLSFTILNDEKE